MDSKGELKKNWARRTRTKLTPGIYVAGRLHFQASAEINQLHSFTAFVVILKTRIPGTKFQIDLALVVCLPQSWGRAAHQTVLGGTR